MEDDELNLITLAQKFSDEDAARTYFEEMRWPSGVPLCPFCGSEGGRVNRKPSGRRKAQKGVCKCKHKDCRKQFTVTKGTVFEASHVGINLWMMCLFIMCASKKGVSAHQIHRMLKLTYKTSWFMAHRIRFAMNEGPLAEVLNGVVEIDETFVGGKGELGTKHLRKTPVVALIQRGGKARTQIVANVTQKNLRKCMAECVSKEAIVNTDQSPVYQYAGKEFARHDVVNHSIDDYAHKNADGSVAHVNTCESFFALLKRGVMGSFYHVSREHLHRYANEFSFRWNNRGVKDGERMEVLVEQTEGKRLTYRQCV